MKEPMFHWRERRVLVFARIALSLLLQGCETVSTKLGDAGQDALGARWWES